MRACWHSDALAAIARGLAACFFFALVTRQFPRQIPTQRLIAPCTEPTLPWAFSHLALHLASHVPPWANVDSDNDDRASAEIKTSIFDIVASQGRGGFPPLMSKFEGKKKPSQVGEFVPPQRHRLLLQEKTVWARDEDYGERVTEVAAKLDTCLLPSCTSTTKHAASDCGARSINSSAVSGPSCIFACVCIASPPTWRTSYYERTGPK